MQADRVNGRSGLIRLGRKRVGLSRGVSLVCRIWYHAPMKRRYIIIVGLVAVLACLGVWLSRPLPVQPLPSVPPPHLKAYKTFAIPELKLTIKTFGVSLDAIESPTNVLEGYEWELIEYAERE